MALPSGISASDFTAIPLADWGRTVSYEAPTRTVNNATGDEELTYGAASNITAIFHLRRKRRQWTKDGWLELGDAYIMVDPTQATLVEDARVTVDSQVFRVGKVQDRPNTENLMFRFAECWKLEDS